MTDVVQARPSASVVLVRRAAAEPEIFMVRRHENSSFGSACAFPGGVVDPEDSGTRDYCGGLSEADANLRLGVGRDGLNHYSAAIRELFEEAGVLFADWSNLDENLQSIRDGLNDGSLLWDEFVKGNKLPLFCDRLHYFSHWVTPPQQPKRYSTRFFLAALPDGQVASHCGGELTASRWVTAGDMLAAGRNGEVELHFPTIKILESLARHKTFQSLTDWARSSVEWGITTMVPMIIQRNGKPVIALPGEKDYPGAKS